MKMATVGQDDGRDINKNFWRKVAEAMEKSIKKKARSKACKSKKPQKPFPDFPLNTHASGRWYKKIRGRFFYFGKVEGDESGTKALELFNREWPFLKDGRVPPPDGFEDGLKLQFLCNSFLTSKLAKVRSDELSHVSFLSYQRSCDSLIDFFGKARRVDDLGPHDFEKFRAKLAKGAPTSLNRDINLCKIVFKYGFDSELLEKPVRFGQSFEKASKKTLRKHRNDAGKKLFTAEEIHRILEACNPVIKGMVLLAVNCGFGNTDVASLPRSAVDLKNGWVDFPRPKTGVERRCPLWPETVEAVRIAIDQRPKPRNESDADLCFLTKGRFAWVRVQEKKSGLLVNVSIINALAARFRIMLQKLEINGRRGLGFYTFRHTFETIGGESKDQVAVDSIMGHTDSSMASLYREGISDERLRAVTETVRNWLRPETGATHKPIINTTPSPASLRSPAIVVEIEYDSRGERKTKRFEDMHAAKSFYVCKDIEGKNPSVKAGA